MSASEGNSSGSRPKSEEESGQSQSPQFPDPSSGVKRESDHTLSQSPVNGSNGSNSANGSNGENGASKPQRKRKKVGMACVYCRRSHMICDEGRPCQRCLKRNIGHLCHDEPANAGRKNKKNPDKSASVSVGPSPSPGVQNIEDTKVDNSSAEKLRPLGIYRHQPISNDMMTYSVNQPPAPNPHGYLSSKPSSTAINQQPFFYSEHAGSEFNSLTEFLSMIDDSDMINSINLDNDPLLNKLDGLTGNKEMPLNLNQVPHFEPAFENSLFIKTPTGTVPPNKPVSSIGSALQMAPSAGMTRTSQTSLDGYFQQPSPVAQQTTQNAVTANGQPYVSDSARDKFFLTAADPTTEISPEERLKQVINAKLEAGLLKPYNYAKGYQRLQTYMDNHMAASSRQRILKPLSTFRPGFRAIAKTLKDIDLILVEENFERMLLDYDRVFTSMAIPACLWRRTGEIYRGNKEFASLVEVSIDDLKNGKLTIYELMTEESSVNFWEKYGAIAFDNTQKAVLTSCNLRSKDGRKKRNCCFSFTIRRDRYSIPSCIVGNFIPIQ
ncbi:hypothetical protein OGAPHI_000628 [Ogataea philodendri]|uniref:Zn(2)-C6 fungal-type domain-containing protein n=1 Tax=Ogataea philodendri TaxID=1378263 RepID=A0A9P8PGN2_9ASCO|nr:uncharacterized protein OGAPHI_000628 [Ogataea philodendri]KAH3670917.1 hypothetical protein OGAPHI_000628 [Ogataea philodendri]